MVTDRMVVMEKENLSLDSEKSIFTRLCKPLKGRVREDVERRKDEGGFGAKNAEQQRTKKGGLEFQKSISRRVR